MAGILPFGKIVRLAIVTNVADDHVECMFYDKIGEKSFKCPIPHPYSGRGGGVLVGVEKDTLVLVTSGFNERWFIVGFIPDLTFFSEMGGSYGIHYDESEFPKLKEGEICLKGNKGQFIKLNDHGNIAIDAKIGDKSYDLEFSNLAQAMFVRTNNVYTFTEAGRVIEGIVKRDLSIEEDELNSKTMDLLSGETYDSNLSPIGRSPKRKVSARTSTIIKPVARNPALVEKREIIYEFGDSFGVRGFDFEKNAIKQTTTSQVAETTQDGQTNQEKQDLMVSDSIQNLIVDRTTRENRRTDILDLNHRNYNHLIERVQGTLVDVYGNILDLNRNPINVPDIDSIINDPNKDLDGLIRMYDYLRRSVKYHFEINSRKNTPADDLPKIPEGIPEDNLKDHSRFSIDIDGEGLTKINIPASTNTGNIPVCGRYVVSRDPNRPDNGAFKNEENGQFVDIKLAQFGAKKTSDDGYGFAGQTIIDESYWPKTTNNLPITVGTAFHDMFDVATSLYTKGKITKNPDYESKGGNKYLLPMSTTINNHIPSKNETDDVISQGNAGGKSLHANFDGSIEMSVGADNLDKKSIILDTQGGMITRIGADKNNFSVIGQTDGYVAFQLGGINPEGVDKPGRLEIHLNRPGASPNKITIDEYGITISSGGGLVLESEGDLILNSLSSVLIQGKNIAEYGTHDSTTRKISQFESKVLRTGKGK